jgi:GntR family transcriptional regulator
MNGTITETNIPFSLDMTNGVPIYRQIIVQIENGILSGRMKPGDKLPTIRSLAVALKANPNTIAKAYGELEIRGVLITQVGSGTYISNKKPSPDDRVDIRKQKVMEVTERFMREMRDLGVDKEELLNMISNWEGYNK